MLERRYQAVLISKLKVKLPGCMVIKNDTGYAQGLPDLMVLYKDRWAALEVKASEGAPERPNQAYYIQMMDSMSFAAFIFPENEREVLDALQQAFGVDRPTRLPKR